MPKDLIEGQLNQDERCLLMEAITNAPHKPQIAIEVGTWLGGGSTLHILRALEQNGAGHLWGIECNRSIYEKMLNNIRTAAPEACNRFTPLFGFSNQVIPNWLWEQPADARVDFVFLDGGNNPKEQIQEFTILDSRIPIGGQLMAHDAKLRKGKWLVPYLMRLDYWESKFHDVSEYGLFHAQKVAAQPSAKSRRAARSHLFKLRCQPLEVAAAIVPSPICTFALNLLPKKVTQHFVEGWK